MDPELDGRVMPVGPRLPPLWPRTWRGRYVARMLVFVLVLASQGIGLFARPTDDHLLWLRIALVALAGVFFVGTTVDYIRRSRKGQ